MDFFDIGFGVFSALGQAIFMVVGFIFALLGVLILVDDLRWRSKATRVKARIKSLKAETWKGENQSEIYYPVYEYTARNGELTEAVSDSGSSSLRGKEPGRRTYIYIMPDEPRKARTPGIGGILVALFVVAIGAAPLGVGILAYPVNKYTFIALALVIAFAAMKFSRYIKPKDQWETLKQFKERKMKQFLDEKRDMRDVDAQAYKGLMQKQAKMQKYQYPIMLLLAAVFLGVGYYMGMNMLDLTQHGVHAPARVVDMNRSESHSDGKTSVSYRSVVTFKTPEGREILFTDKMGSSSPMEQVGDEVDVLYMPDNPGGAMINRGWMNWLFPGIFSGIGLVVLLIALGGMMRPKRV